MVKRVKLIVAYDGTAYCGWQLQPNGRTIEGELNQALSSLLQEDIHVIGASRTDSGVHALCNIAVFDTQTRIPAEKISYALNQRLPEDIRIKKSCEVAADFHPRHCSSRKTYEYRIYQDTFPEPVRRLYTYFTYVPLDLDRMREGAAYLVGEHDFKSFCSVAAVVETTVRTILSINIEKQGKEIVISVCGTGFLYNMVRIITGTLAEVGLGRRRPQELAGILASRDRQQAGHTAPAAGLYLVEVYYDEQRQAETER